MAVGADLARLRLDRSGEQAARHRVADCLEFTAHSRPFRPRTLCGAAGAC
jgi:hypothetical protein